jgi:hypothetical protein
MGYNFDSTLLIDEKGVEGEVVTEDHIMLCYFTA